MSEKTRSYDWAKEYLSYNKETGIITWIKRPKQSQVIPGNQITSKDAYGYFRVQFKGLAYKAHRLAWFLHTGEIPNGFIDHINGNPGDNRIVNLRVVSLRDNTSNQEKHRNGKLVGASYCKLYLKWKSKIDFKGKRISLGYHDTEQSAHDAYIKFRKENSI